MERRDLAGVEVYSRGSRPGWLRSHEGKVPLYPLGTLEIQSLWPLSLTENPSGSRVELAAKEVNSAKPHARDGRQRCDKRTSATLSCPPLPGYFCRRTFWLIQHKANRVLRFSP